MADKIYVVEKRVSGGSMSHFVTIQNVIDDDAKMRPVLQQEKGTLSFDGHAHDVVVLKK